MFFTRHRPHNRAAATLRSAECERRGHVALVGSSFDARFRVSVSSGVARSLAHLLARNSAPRSARPYRTCPRFTSLDPCSRKSSSCCPLRYNCAQLLRRRGLLDTTRKKFVLKKRRRPEYNAIAISPPVLRAHPCPCTHAHTRI